MRLAGFVYSLLAAVTFFVLVNGCSSRTVGVGAADAGGDGSAAVSLLGEGGAPGSSSTGGAGDAAGGMRPQLGDGGAGGLSDGNAGGATGISGAGQAGAGRGGNASGSGGMIAAQAVRQGLEWLIEQNDSGAYAGMLAVDCAATIGYSMGGGAAVEAGAHPAVKAIVSMHGLTGPTESASGAILLTTSEEDTFVPKSGFVEPSCNRSAVQPTVLASHATGVHTEPVGDGGEDLAPAIARLRYWIYGDETRRAWFFGDSCTLSAWPDFRRKNFAE